GALVQDADPHEPWRLLSYGFLHIGFRHLLNNGAALFVMGVFLESLLGSRRFLLLYALSMLGGGLAIVAVGTARVTAGASGALWGLMLAQAALVARRGYLVVEDEVTAKILDKMKKRIWPALFLNLLNSFRPGVSLAGHLGGGFVGAVLTLSGALTAGLGQVPGPAEARSL